MSDMGTGEIETPTKTTKTSTATAQEQQPSSVPMSYPEWAAAFQAYYNSGTHPLPPPGYFPSSVGSGPQPHPYLWAAQPLMPPYGTPPYAAMYPHGGMYAHPTIPPGAHTYSPYGLSIGTANEVSGAVASSGIDTEGKALEGKDRSPLKRSKGSLGSLGVLSGKGAEVAKGPSGSMNGALSHSGDSGSEGSSEGSEDNSQNGGQRFQKRSFDQSTSDAPLGPAGNYAPYGSIPDVNHATGKPVAAIPISIAGKQIAGVGPMTNLNIGMEYWSGGMNLGAVGTRGKRVVTTSAMIPATTMLGQGRDVVSSELWLQDERELKRQRRKQSNRESARRSRLRKQAECEELAAKVENLNSENSTLRTDLNHMTELCKKLSAENESLQEQLQMRSGNAEEGQGEQAEKDGLKLAKLEKDSDQEEVDHADDSTQGHSRSEDETPDSGGKDV